MEEETRFVRLLPKGMYHNEFQLPGLTLADANGIIDVAVSEVRMSSLHHNTNEISTSMKCSTYIRPYALERAHKVYNSMIQQGKSGVSIYRLSEVLSELGLNMSTADVTEIVAQLELKDTLEVSFAEAVEIATYIHEQKMEAQQLHDSH